MQLREAGIIDLGIIDFGIILTSPDLQAPLAFDSGVPYVICVVTLRGTISTRTSLRVIGSTMASIRAGARKVVCIGRNYA